MKITEWLNDFMAEFAASYGCPDWPRVGTEIYDTLYKDWYKSFARHGISRAEAEEARSLLAEDPPHFKAQCLPKLLVAHRATRQTHEETGIPAEVPLPRADQSTIDASRGCPECTRERGRLKSVGPTGWARRRTLWHSHSAPMTVELFCRCPLGRWRLVNDIELVRNEKVRQHDDLQARPELWNLEVNHPSWSWQSRTHDLVMPEGTEGLWRYLKIDEPAPAPIRPRDLAARISASMGKVEPAVPIPPRPAAPPDEPPPPKWETTIDGDVQP